MDAGLTGAPRSEAEAGFSLLEVLVSIAVLAILAVGVGLGSGGGMSATERDADRFRRAYEQNWALAVMGREQRGLNVTARGLTLLRRGSGRWTPPAPLYDWGGSASLTTTDFTPAGSPDIVLYPDARSTGFTVIFSGRGPRQRCTTDGQSDLTCAAN